MNTTSIFFNHSFDKKRLKAFIYWVLKTFGEKEALTMVEELKRMGFYNATKAGLSIGLHDLKTPLKKTSLISSAEITMNKTDQEFQGAELTATERSQRIIDTWHRTSEDLRKQVVDYFSTYDQLNSVYMMALSGARGNFSQVRQLIGMRGLMADPQGQIISFPIRSNLREGLTLTEYFISCSGARKGLVDTALRTADTGYLTRRLVDISHHIVVKKVTCHTSRGIALKTLRTSQKILLPLKDRLVGRVLGENVYEENAIEAGEAMPSFEKATQIRIPVLKRDMQKRSEVYKTGAVQKRSGAYKNEVGVAKRGFAHPAGLFASGGAENKQLIAKKNQEISPNLAFKISLLKESGGYKTGAVQKRAGSPGFVPPAFLDSQEKKDVWSVPSVLVRSPLTCTYTHEVCQLCYGWSMAQGSLVSLGEAVGVIAGQSIGEPGTQLTMRTFHTGGVFSGDLLQEIRAPHSGKICFPKALQGLLIRSSQGKIAFLIKVSGELLIESDDSDQKDQPFPNRPGLLARTSLFSRPETKRNFMAQNSKIKEKKAGYTTKLLLEPSTILFVRQGEKVKSNQILAELAITSEEGNQPIQSRQTLFSENRGRVVQWKSMLSKIHREKGTAKRKGQGFGESQQMPYPSRLQLGQTQVITTETLLQRKPGIKAYLGNAEATLSFFGAQNLLYSTLNTVNSQKQLSFIKLLPSMTVDTQHYEEMWGNVKNHTLKQIVLSKKHGLGAIEPPKALELGLLSVLAIQIGASEKTSTKGITHSKLKFEQAFQSEPTNDSGLQNEVGPCKNGVFATALQKRRFCMGPLLHFPVFVRPAPFLHGPIYCTKLGQNKNKRLSDLNVYFTGLRHLNTIAEEGDLVDENYNQI